MIQPLPHRVLVRVLPRHQSKLDIVLVDKKRHYEGQRRGEVLAVGRGIDELNTGDVVHFHGAQGKSFDKNSAGFNDGIGLRVLKPNDILAVEEKVEVPA